ncbi:MAG TPA: hypothetical protein VIO58_02950 [Candidatus Methanoperedens sp.]
MKREMIKTTVVYLLLVMVGIVIFTDSAFAAKDVGQPVPLVPPVTEIRVPNPCDELLGAGTPEPGQSIIEQICLQPDLVYAGFGIGIVAGKRFMLVEVANRGNADANANSTTRVDFYLAEGQGTAAPFFIHIEKTDEILTPPIKKGSSVLVPEFSLGIEVPTECYSRTCYFIVTVDAKNEIREIPSGEDGANIFPDNGRIP